MSHRKLLSLGLIILGVTTLAACGVNPASVVDQVYLVVAGILPIIGGLVGVLLPNEVGAITSATNMTLAALNALKQLVDDYHSSPTGSKLANVQAAFADVRQNLAQLEAAARVRDLTTQKRLLAIVTAVTQSLAALESAMAADHAKAVVASQARS